jgi:glycosyltransferase involved in cell wall biosynthesis
MKVLHITLGLGNGGAEGALFRLVKFDKLNEHVIISIMGDGIYGEQLRALGNEVFSLDIPQGKFQLGCIYTIYKLVKKISPDVVQTWLYHADLLGGVIARVAGVKAVVWGIRHSNLDEKLNSRVIIYIAKISAMFSGILPRKIISCSEKAAEVHIKIGYNEDKMSVIPNGYDLSKLRFSQEARFRNRTLWGVNDDFVFGMVGRWNPLKDHANFIKAIACIAHNIERPIKCVLVGPGIDDSNTELTALIHKYELKHVVSLIGPTSDINEVMSAFDALVLPSSGEAFPNVVAEAMACSTPCIVTDVGDAALIVNKFGCVVPPVDHIALSVAMEKLICQRDNHESWAELKENCRKRIEDDFSIEKMVSRFDKIWKSALH